MPHSMSTGAQSSSITRRRLTAGAAWATPTLVVGAAAPATAVTGLTFTITDLDTDSGNFIDVVELSGAFTVTSSSPGVGGSATQTSPARQQQAGAPLPNSSADGNLTVSYAGPITSFTLTYWIAVETFDLLVDRAQAIYITDMTLKSRSAC